MLKPLWMILPVGLKSWLMSIWVQIKSLLFGKIDRDEVPTSSEFVIVPHSWSDIEASDLAIVDFGAEWCGPCKRVSPMFHTLASEYAKSASFFAIDIDHHQDLAIDKGVSSIPAFHVYKRGELVEKLVGSDASKLLALVKKVCN